MSGHRAYFKNDSFFLGLQRENQKKIQQQIQRKKQAEQKRLLNIQKYHQKQKKEIEEIKDPQQKIKRENKLRQIQAYRQRKQQQKLKKQQQKIFEANKKIELIQRQNQQIFKKNLLHTQHYQFLINPNNQSQKQKKDDLDLEQLERIIEKKKQKKATKSVPNPISSSAKQQKLSNLTTNQCIQKQIKTHQKITSAEISKTKQEDDFDSRLQAFQKNKIQNYPNQQYYAHQFSQKLNIYKPTSTLKQVLPEPKKDHSQKNVKQKSKRQLQRERREQDKKLKKQFAQLIHKDDVEEQKKNKNNQIQKDHNQNNSQDQDQKKNDQNIKQKGKSNRKIKKVNNYQKLDLKRRYTDKFVGGLRENQRKYQKNGVLKPKFRMAQSELQLQNSEVYNTYIHSLSKSFHVNISIDSDSEQVQIQEEKRSIEIPSPQECTEQRLTSLIREIFGFQKFRQGQFQVIQKVLNHQSTIFVSETASGKSLTYILSSLIMSKSLQGMSIVISPLIALILDQLEHLPVQLPAACISSLINYQQRNKILELVKTNQVKLLFLTPQMLMTDILFHIKQFPKINFVCIDQAHCLSQLSQNFRTSYLTLAQIIKNHINYNNSDSKPNILCLTATANSETIQSLVKKLQIKNVIKSSSTLNKNLYITITRQVGSENIYKALVDYLNTKQIRACNGILIYCRSKYIIERVYNYLSNSLIHAVIFHGGLPNKDKTRIISDFKVKTIKIIVSTTALGMGLDFQHLDCIIHFNMPKSLESFVQQTGRAGRRQTRGYCQLFLDESDFFMQRNYILADQLENQSIKTIVSCIKNSQLSKRIKSKKKPQAFNQIQKQQQIERIIQKAVLKIETIELKNKNDEEVNQSSEEQSSLLDEYSISSQQISDWTPLYYIRVKQLAEKTFLREEALLTILIKIADYLNKQIIMNSQKVMKIHPLSHQILKLSFFKTNEKELIQNSEFGQFYKKLVDIPNGKNQKPKCKKVSGAYHIHIIQKCNQLEITPIELMTRVYEISNIFVMKVEFVTEVYVLSIRQSSKGIENSDFIRFKDILQKLQSKDFQTQVINQVNMIQKTTMIKLQVFYSLAFNYSQVTVNELLKKKLIIDRFAAIPTDNIMNEITKYFNMELNKFYNYIAETEDQEQREMFLPTENIQALDIKNVYEHTKLFFKHQYSNLRDISNKEECLKKKQSIIEEYKDGKVITRVFLGVNEEKSSRFIFGEHTYWRKFFKKKYFSLLKTVRELIEQKREDLMYC